MAGRLVDGPYRPGRQRHQALPVPGLRAADPDRRAAPGRLAGVRPRRRRPSALAHALLGRPRPARRPVSDALPVTAVGPAEERPDGWDERAWPATVPCVRKLLEDGLDLGPLTVLVGENGSGKSTVIEAIAQRYGLSPEGGSTGARHSTRPSESPLWRAITLRRGIGAARWGFFLRAETMHGYYTYLEANPAGPLHHDNQRVVEPFHEMSHGESFLEVLGNRFRD